MTPLRVVRTRAERAAREAAILAGVACEFCGDTGRVLPVRVCGCADFCAPQLGLLKTEGDAAVPVCDACWTPAFEHRLCEGCRIRGGEEVTP